MQCTPSQQTNDEEKMPTYRISYCIKGQSQRKEFIWTAEPKDSNLTSLGVWIMRKEFPGLLYRIDIGMEEVLRKHGITEIRTPIPFEKES
jgi:hypothetical protein